VKPAELREVVLANSRLTSIFIPPQEILPRVGKKRSSHKGVVRNALGTTDLLIQAE
jgi:hypothetical protein